MLHLAPWDHEIAGKGHVRATRDTWIGSRINRRFLGTRGRNLRSRIHGLVVLMERYAESLPVVDQTDRHWRSVSPR